MLRTDWRSGRRPVIQIIGWLGCLYLIVKGLEIASSSAFRNEHGNARSGATAACMVAWIGALVFAVWLLLQGDAGGAGQEAAETTMSQSKTDCISNAKTADEVIAC